MRNEEKDFLRTLCTVSATMASLCFVGVGVIITILYESKEEAWKGVAYSGAVAVLFFAAASVSALAYLGSKKPKEHKTLLRVAPILFAVGWICFFILISILITALSV